MDFTTELSGWDVMVYNISDSDKETDTESAFTIKWQFYTEMREWGVKDVGIYATEVIGEIEVTYYNDDDTESVETQTITSEAEGWELGTDTGNIEWGDKIKPQDLEIDFKSKTITVIF